MKVMRIVAVLSASIPLMIAGCKTQPQKAAPDSAHAVAQAAAPSPASTTPTNAQKPSLVFVYSAPLSVPPATPAANGGQEEVREGGSRLDLPQANEYVELRGAARTTLETTLSGATGSSPVLLPEATATLMGGLPKEFRDSCNEMLELWGEGVKGTAKWTVRVLFSLHYPEGTEAVLAFRCASIFGLENDYDERPAIVSLTPEAATLNFIPLDEKCDNCSDLYHLEFSQAFTAVGSRLAELRVHYSNHDNPGIAGEDEESGNRMMILDLSRGKQVLGVDERTERSSHDDSTEDADTYTICESKISYLRDGAGNVESVNTETRCTENKEPLPEVKRQSFRWNAEAHRYDEVK